MQKDVLFKAAGYSRKQKRKKIWLRIVAFMSAIVVFCTTYALILPGITRERTAYCGFTEHTHGDECYETVIHTEINCAASIHKHIDGECYDDDGNIYCRSADYFIHSHNEYCYNEEHALICTLPEIETHIHNEECFEVTEENTEPLLICDKDELSLHTHSDECFDENGEYICEEIELFEHIHGKECVITTEEKNLVCCEQEHTHSEECYIDKSVDIETEAAWMATLPEQLTGMWNNDLVLTAKSQLGYIESDINAEIDEYDIKHGYTRYGEWYGEPYSDWSELFVMFCLEYAGIDSDVFPSNADSEEWIKLLDEAGYLRDSLTYTPNIGDILFIDGGVAVITELLNDENKTLTSLKVIEGDSEDCVRYCEYAVPNDKIEGYGDIGAAYKDFQAISTVTKEYKDEKITVTATYLPFAEIPEDAELSVVAIEDSERYQTRFDEAHKVINEASGKVKDSSITDFWLYDICLVSNGVEIQPNDSVNIQIMLNDKVSEDAEEISVVHFTKEGTELPVLSTQEKDEELSVGFSVDSFSEFAIVGSTNTVLDILSMTKCTTGNISTTQTFAIVEGNYALLLTVEDGVAVLSPSEVWSHELDSKLSIDKRAQQWIIADSRISTTVDSTTYYLVYSDNQYIVTTNLSAATTFTTYWTNSVFRANTNGNYLSVTSDAFSSNSATNLSLYSASSGSYKVVFDAQIGNAQYMGSNNRKYKGAERITVTTTNGKVVLPHNDPNSPDTENYISIAYGDSNTENDWYKLNGWYDIVNEVFYDSSMLGKEITVSSNTIFYPEYISATYDVGQDNGKVVQDQPDTRDFINTYMFDYNEIFNVDKSDCISYDGEYTTVWKTDMDNETPLIFTDWINPSGNIGYMQGLGDATPGGITTNMEKTAGTRGNSVTFPGTITTGIVGDIGASNVNNPQIDALFSHETVPGRVFLGEADWLYQYDDNIGYYYYNSADNAAAYNQSNQRFYIYDYTLKIDNNGSLHDFTPYTYRDAPIGGEGEAAEKDTELNYWVGMQSEIEFYLPHDSGNDSNKSTHGDDLQLRFSGDDDVWIFLDGKLVIDLGGMHDVVYGEINFAKGWVSIAHSPNSSSVAQNSASAYTEMPGVQGPNAVGVTTTDIPFTVEGGQYHTVTIYYLERGSALSNCAIYFNISPFYELELIKKDAATGKGLQGAEFTIYSDPECTIPAMLYEHDENGNITPSDATFVSDEDGVAWVEGLSAGGTYYIKETKPPGHYPDMSMYIIVANLARPGESVTIALDSNGKEFVYAEEYVFSAEHEHRVEINIYNDMFVGGEKEVYVRKRWGEGSNPEPVTLRLYANGVPIDRFVELNADCNWEATLYSLPEHDSEGNEIEYTFKEVSGPSGYGVTYEWVGVRDTVVYEPGYWNQVSSLTAGKKYRLVYNGNAISCSNNGAVVPSSASDSDATTHWIAEATGSKFLLRNDSNGSRYLHIANGSITATTTSTADNNELTVNSAGRISASYRPSNSWRTYTYYIVSNTSSYSTTTSSTSGTRFTLYEWVEPREYTITEVVNGWEVTNTPWPEYTSIPIAKTWDATVGAPPAEQKFALYLVTEGHEDNPIWVSDLTLNGEGSWMGSFYELAYPDPGSYYAVLEVTDEYQPKYSNTTVSIYVDGEFKEAAKVEFDSSGTAVTVEVNNTKLLKLPETGGWGTKWYTIGGTLLIVSAAALLLYKKRRCRSEDYFTS